ncbi:MAG: YidC/Oxa1 family membrane protein insertase [Eubacteriales bacterium]|nr:YidC/Oxa1 family membrane protein insertase [Eubacteriales bacterium]
MEIIGSLFGYVLWFAYELVHSYALAIIIFTVIAKLVLFPASVKQQKSMAGNARMQKKMAALREKYANNKEKLNEETQKLYSQEGMNPYGGCLTSIVPMFIMLGVFYAVAYPLTNTLHISKDMVASAKDVLVSIPGLNVGTTAMYGGQIDILKYFGSFESIQACFEGGKHSIAEIGEFCSSFNLTGFNLLETPSQHGFSVYLLIPVLCFVTSVGSQYFIQKLNSNGAPQQGCMKLMILALPLFSAYIAYTVPSAVGFYWICSTVLGFVQSLIMHYFFGPDMMIARGEAARVALLEQEEARVQEVR